MTLFDGDPVDREASLGAPLAQRALERIEAELSALSREELLPIKLNVSAAVTTVLRALPGLRELRAQMVDELPRFDLARFDRLEDYAVALGQAHEKVLVATSSRHELEEPAAAALEMRERLLADVTVLVRHRIVDEAALAPLRGAKGHKKLASDLMTLVAVLREAWPRIEGKLFITALELDAAREAAARLLCSVNERERAQAELAAAMARRVRAFTLLASAYDDARRAVAYLRARAGDAHRVAPSLYPGRPRSNRTSGAAPRVPATDGAEALTKLLR